MRLSYTFRALLKISWKLVVGEVAVAVAVVVGREFDIRTAEVRRSVRAEGENDSE